MIPGVKVWYEEEDHLYFAEFEPLMIVVGSMYQENVEERLIGEVRNIESDLEDGMYSDDKDYETDLLYGINMFWVSLQEELEG